jgi:cob(I)alamin adenosyltransferase
MRVPAYLPLLPGQKHALIHVVGQRERERSLAMIATKQAEMILPTMRAAVAALHEVWAKCREVERAIGHDLDGL